MVSDLQGVPARAILQALVDAERDPQALAELARGRMRSKIDQLTEALAGRFNDHHRFMVRSGWPGSTGSASHPDHTNRRDGSTR